VDGRQKTDDLHVGGINSNFLLRFPESSRGRAAVAVVRATAGKGDLAGMGGHGVGTLGQHNSDVTRGVLVESDQHRSHRKLARLGRFGLDL
jgi:hypothetical protein